MNDMESLQWIREQLKITSRELKRAREEKEKVESKFQELILANQKEISYLRETIQQKNKEISAQQPSDPQSGEPRTYLKEKPSGAADEIFSGNNKQPFTEENIFRGINPHEKEEILRNRTQLLKEQIEEKRHAIQELEKQNSLLLREINRLHKEARASESMKSRMESLRAQLRQAKAASLDSGKATADIVREKDFLIEKYEKMIYGETGLDQKDILPAAIIQELREEVEELEIEKRKMLEEMNLLKLDNEEMESRIFLLEEKGNGEGGEYRPNIESRAAVSAEFSTGLESFLITYSDLITLILVIFVLLYSISQLDSGKFSEALSSFQEKELRVDNLNVRLNDEEFKMLKRVRELVKDNVDPESLVRSDTKTILIRLKSSDLFSPGSTDLKEGAEDFILNSIKDEIREGVKQVYVEGHTDDIPLKPNQNYPSNWELSSVRASHVARVLIDKLRFAPERIVVTGYGQYRPYKPNNSDKNRALNRRVEIKILKDRVVLEEEDKDTALPKDKKNARVLNPILPLPDISTPDDNPQNR